MAPTDGHFSYYYYCYYYFSSHGMMFRDATALKKLFQNPLHHSGGRIDLAVMEFQTIDIALRRE